LTLAIQDNRLKKNSQVSNLINEDKHYYSNLFTEVMNSN
jgi:hypothetical protein